MVFARPIWDSIIDEMSMDVPSMTLHIVTRTKTKEGVEHHLLSLVGISSLAATNELPLPMSMAEIRDFGIALGPNNQVVVTFEVTDQATFTIVCANAHFDGTAFVARSTT
jgi:hypothetical protein